LAPEVQAKTEYKASADVWALAVTLYMCMFGHDPWKKFTYEVDELEGEFLLCNQDTGKAIDQSNTGHNLYFPPDTAISQQLKQIFASMLQFDPNHRANWSGLLQMLSDSYSPSQLRSNHPSQATCRFSFSDKSDPSYDATSVFLESNIIENIKIYLDRMDENIENIVQSKAAQPEDTRSREHQEASEQYQHLYNKEVAQLFLEYNYQKCLFHKEVCRLMKKLMCQRSEWHQEKPLISLIIFTINKINYFIADYFLQKKDSKSRVLTQLRNERGDVEIDDSHYEDEKTNYDNMQEDINYFVLYS
jgi:serine/threonine protein kinase